MMMLYIWTNHHCSTLVLTYLQDGELEAANGEPAAAAMQEKDQEVACISTTSSNVALAAEVSNGQAS